VLTPPWAGNFGSVGTFRYNRDCKPGWIGKRWNLGRRLLPTIVVVSYYHLASDSGYFGTIALTAGQE